MKLAVSSIDIEKATDAELLEELKEMVSLRKKMCGDMYYNMCNNDAHQIAHYLLLRRVITPEAARDILEGK